MTRDIIDIHDFTILVEKARTDLHPTVSSCFFDEPVIGVAFYGSGNVHLTVKYGHQQQNFDYTKGLALSFYADGEVAFVHQVSATSPLECLVIVTAMRNLKNLPNQEGALFDELLHQLVHSQNHYVAGPNFLMTPLMQALVKQVFHNQFSGKAKMMFFRSQMTTLLAHFFGELSLVNEKTIPANEKAKLLLAKEILSENLEAPPSLSELARQIGLNTFKLKKNFKELFGVPVFKYLQHERLTKAYELLRNERVSIQEAAWHVGYDSLSSFSNAFHKKFGFRPSEIKR
ncbi:MAG: helix-turn-helix transcriptional regulator [Bacteroidia bacterium]|nr:helix-turn-helix transcriptional regulator [Bacteroidia bacterium]